MKPITKQLTMATLVLASVTILSLGIRQVRFSLHRARHTSSAPTSTRPARFESRDMSGLSYSDDKARLGQVLDGFATQDYRPSDAGAIPGETDSEDAGGSGQEAWTEDYIELNPESGEHADSVSMDKWLKGDYAKSKGSKGLQKISLGAYENVYVTEAGEYWYVRKQPDGTTTKMQFQVKNHDGEVVIVGAGGSNGLQRISVGDNEDVYITEAGEHWYVSTEADGTTTKMRFQVEDGDGKVVITSAEEANVYPPE